MIANKNIIGKFVKAKIGDDISSLSQKLCEIALEDKIHLASVVNETNKIRDKYEQILATMGFKILKGYGNFITLSFIDDDQAQAAFNALQKFSLTVKWLVDYNLSSFLRITIGEEDIIIRAVQILRHYIRDNYYSKLSTLTEEQNYEER